MSYLNGLIRYDVQRDPHDHALEKVLPAEVAPVHAVRVRRHRRTPRHPEFLEPRWYETAMCGATVKVLLPTEFDPGDEDSCQPCAGSVLRGETHPVRRGRHEDPADDLPARLQEPT